MKETILNFVPWRGSSILRRSTYEHRQRPSGSTDGRAEARRPVRQNGILQELTKALAERALSAELDEHLIEERSDRPPEGRNLPLNRRNGTSPKTVTTDSGKVVLDLPRDRNGSFDPLLIAKYQRRFPEFDTKIIHCPAGYCAAMSREGACTRAA